MTILDKHQQNQRIRNEGTKPGACTTFRGGPVLYFKTNSYSNFLGRTSQKNHPVENFRGGQFKLYKAWDLVKFRGGPERKKHPVDYCVHRFFFFHMAKTRWTPNIFTDSEPPNNLQFKGAD